MRTKPILGLAGLFLAGVTLSGCENCGWCGRRGPTAGYDHTTAIGMNGATPTTGVAQGTMPTSPTRSMVGSVPTTSGDLAAKPAGTPGSSSGTQASNYATPPGNVPPFTTPSTGGTPSGYTNGTPSGYTNPSGGVTPAGMPSTTDRSTALPTTPGTMDGSSRFSSSVPPPSGLPRTGSTPGIGSSLTPGLPTPPASSYTPGSGVPTLKNTDQ